MNLTLVRNAHIIHWLFVMQMQVLNLNKYLILRKTFLINKYYVENYIKQ